MRNKSNVAVKAKVASIQYASKEKQPKENVAARRKSGSQTSKEEDGCLISGPKTPASKALQDSKPPEVKARANQDLSGKEKVVKTAWRNVKILHFVKLFSNIVIS